MACRPAWAQLMRARWRSVLGLPGIQVADTRGTATWYRCTAWPRRSAEVEQRYWGGPQPWPTHTAAQE